MKINKVGIRSSKTAIRVRARLESHSRWWYQLLAIINNFKLFNEQGARWPMAAYNIILSECYQHTHVLSIAIIAILQWLRIDGAVALAYNNTGSAICQLVSTTTYERILMHIMASLHRCPTLTSSWGNTKKHWNTNDLMCQTCPLLYASTLQT